MADLVRGEASESDEELLGGNSLQKEGVLAAEVSGEATESDEELYEKKVCGSVAGNSADTYKNNILQRKLIENNLSIWRDLAAYVKSFIVYTSKQLLNTDQLLIKSQVSMQSVLSSLKIVQGNIRQLHERSNDVFTTNFIPKINITNTDARQCSGYVD